MALTARKVELVEYDTNKRDFENSMELIADQVRLIDQKVTMKVENEIWQCFQSKQTKINETKSFINKVSSIAKNDIL